MVKKTSDPIHTWAGIITVILLLIGAWLVFDALSGPAPSTSDEDPDAPIIEVAEPEGEETQTQQNEDSTDEVVLSDEDRPEPTLTPVPANDAVEPSIVGSPSDITVVVNKLQALPSSYVPAGLQTPAVTLDSNKAPADLQLRSEAARAAEELFNAAGQANQPLQLISAYRSYSTQNSLFNSYAASFGEAEANRFSARAGQSEHQLGLAMDVAGTDGLCILETCFGATTTGQWVAENAHNFGFIVRYPPGAEGITGYSYEPWHLRYVGVETAQGVHSSGLTLEQYLQ